MNAQQHVYIRANLGLVALLALLVVVSANALRAESDDAKKALEAANAASATFEQNFQQDFSRAIAAYTEAIRLDPNCTEAYVRRSEIYERSDMQLAIDDLTRAIRINPDSTDNNWLYQRRGHFYGRVGEYDRAIADYSELIRRSPIARRIYYVLRSHDYKLKGDYEHAIADYQAIIQFNPKDSDAWYVIGWIYATCPDAKVRNGAKAVEYATKACEISSWGRARDLDTLAAAYAESGNFAEAMKWEKKSLEGGLADDEMDGASQRLSLYQRQQAYHETPKSS
jgi:tetratricopeptide (TPR) repeat protein